MLDSDPRRQDGGTKSEHMHIDSIPLSYTSLARPAVVTPETVPAHTDRLPLGVAQADSWLSGGLRPDAVHEIFAAQAHHEASALAFALLLAHLQHKRQGGEIIWARSAPSKGLLTFPYGPGLAELGLDPAAVTLLRLPDARAVLRAGLDVVRDGAASAMLIELGGGQPLLDLTATRRLALAAAESGVLTLLIRAGAKPTPSAAQTRWHATSASSRWCEAHAPGQPAFVLDLLRQRGGRDGLHIILEWDRDTASFRAQNEGRAPAAALPCAVPALATRRASDEERHRAA